MIDIIYYGPFKEHIKNHIELKQSVGYKYIAEAKSLKRFDMFTLAKYNLTTTLTKEIVLEWCHKKHIPKNIAISQLETISRR